MSFLKYMRSLKTMTVSAMFYPLLLLIILCCSPSRQNEELEGLDQVPVTYAKGFGIWQGDGFKVVEVSQAFPGKHEPFRYLVLENGGAGIDHESYDAVVSLPLES